MWCRHMVLRLVHGNSSLSKMENNDVQMFSILCAFYSKSVCCLNVRPQDVQTDFLLAEQNIIDWWDLCHLFILGYEALIEYMAVLCLPSVGDPVRPQYFWGDALLWNMAADMYAWRGQDFEPRPSLLQTWAWQSGKPGHLIEQFLRDETSVSCIVLILKNCFCRCFITCTNDHLTYFTSVITFFFYEYFSSYPNLRFLFISLGDENDLAHL